MGSDFFLPKDHTSYSTATICCEVLPKYLYFTTLKEGCFLSEEGIGEDIIFQSHCTISENWVGGRGHTW